MAPTEGEGGTVTLERRLEQLSHSLPPGERQLLDRLLEQVPGLRTEPGGTGPEGSQMPQDEAAGGAGEMPTGMAADSPDTVGPTLAAGEMPAGSSQMPAAPMPVVGGDMSLGAGSEMPEARADTARPSTPEPLDTGAGVVGRPAATEAVITNDMPTAMPGLGSDAGMPVVTASPD